MDEILAWDYHTTIDPNTTEPYPDVQGKSFWIPFRLKPQSEIYVFENFSTTL